MADRTSRGLSARPVTESIPQSRDAATADADIAVDHFDGVGIGALRALLRVPSVHLFARVSSTLDVAHRLAADGAPHGALVIAEAQSRGRGRDGKRWSSPTGAGLWITLIARPATADSIRVLTVRLGLVAADVLDAFAGGRLQLKWPNDLHIAGGKVGGVLVEARWRGASAEWLAIGLGINVIAPADAPNATALLPGTARVDVLTSLVPALVASAARTDACLDAEELRAYAQRDLVAGRRADAPARGVILGITAAAELRVATEAGEVACSSGSLVLSEVP